MDKAALYCRLSKEDDDKFNIEDESESIINQRLLLTDYALDKGFKIEAVYVDEDFSGMDSERPDFNRMITDAKLGKFNTVICKTQSRFSRDMEIIERYIHKEFPLMGIRFIGVVDNVDTAVKGNKKARQINSLINEWYIEDLSENVRAVYRKKMELGQFLGAFAPYGYKKSDKDKHILVIDEEAADVVRNIFKLYLQGYSLKQISDKLEDDKVLPPSAYKKSKGLNYENYNTKKYAQKYNLWGTTTIYRILKDTVYLGTLTQAKSSKVSYKSKKVVANSCDKWVVVKNTHKPIIDTETFYKANKLLSIKGNALRISLKNGRKHPLAGRIKCFDCGSSLILTGGGVRRLRCQLHNKTRGNKCSGHYIQSSKVEELVLNSIKKMVDAVLNDEKCKNEIYELINNSESLNKRINQLNFNISELNNEINSASDKFKLLYADRVSGVISKNEFIVLKRDFSNSVEKKEEKLKTLKNELSELKRNNTKTIDVDKTISRYYDCSVLTSEMVEDFIDYVEVSEKDENKNQSIIIHWSI